MSEHSGEEHNAVAPLKGEAGKWEGLSHILRSRSFAVGLTIAALVVGLLVARRFGLGGRLVLSVGLAALMTFGHSLMHRGHGAHGGQQEDPEKNARYSPRRHFGCH